MALRPSQPGKRAIRETALDYEIAQEQAAALGRLGRALKAALRNLSAHDAGEGGSGNALTSPPASSQAVRTRLLDDASYAP